jgi:hypothetical protein
MASEQQIHIVDIRPIVSFLESLEFECHLNADNEYSSVIWQGQMIHGLSQEMALRNGLSNWLRNELGRNWRDVYALMQHYYQTNEKRKTMHPFPASEMNNIETAIRYHAMLETSMYGSK